VINLEDVPFLDSHGLGALLTGYKIFGKDPHKFRLTGLQDQPKLVFELTGYDHVFQTSAHPTENRIEVKGLNLPAFVLSQASASDMAA
jgi:anti-anti-sigma factor